MRILCALILAGLLAGATTWAKEAEKVEFTEAFMNDPANIAVGLKLWNKQCSRCHGKRAYPGRAPKLKPKNLKADFIYKRITKGFRGMPAWRKKYDQNERMSLTAFILSDDFDN